jgi:CheY-like chemotaxis protein
MLGSATASKRVLLVEDTEDVRELTAMLVAAFGHDVKTASDGTSGLAACLAQHPDVALVDLGLPGIDGFELARRARAAGSTSVLVALSGYGAPEDVKRAYDAGFDIHLTKPVDGKRLRALLESEPTMLRGAGARSEVE